VVGGTVGAGARKGATVVGGGGGGGGAVVVGAAVVGGTVVVGCAVVVVAERSVVVVACDVGVGSATEAATVCGASPFGTSAPMSISVPTTLAATITSVRRYHGFAAMAADPMLVAAYAEASVGGGHAFAVRGEGTTGGGNDGRSGAGIVGGVAACCSRISSARRRTVTRFFAAVSRAITVRSTSTSRVGRARMISAAFSLSYVPREKGASNIA
jgi:hypothetical protein